LDQIGEGLQEVGSITVMFIILMTLGVAIMGRFFGLYVGIRED